MSQLIGIATEDELSESVIEKILNSAPADFTIVVKQRKGGFGYLKSNVTKFNEIARTYPFLMLTDLDSKACAVELISSWLTIPQNSNFLFRVAVREIEAWLLADREAISKFLNVSFAMCPGNPDALADPKQELLKLAKISKSRDIKRDLLPAKGSTSSVGLGYNTRLSYFVWNHWDINNAITRSDSLERAWKRICSL